MQLILEGWHPERPLRWSSCQPVELPPVPDAPLPTLPSLASLRPFLGEEGWVLRFRQGSEGVTALLCTESPPWPGRWEETSHPPSRAPWSQLAWRHELQTWLQRLVGPHRLYQHRIWGRSTVWRVESTETLWFKESYRLPPGEGAALRLASAHTGRMVVPDVVAGDDHRVLMRPLQGCPLGERPPEDWAEALQAVLAFLRDADPEAWARKGIRDLRAGSWHARLAELFSAYGLDTAYADILAPRFDGLPVGVLPQDLGPMNLRWLGGGCIQAFDWSDVVISTPGLLLKRFLNECRTDADREAVVTAFGDDALWEATQQCVSLHETWRYHQELAWLDEDDPLAVWLRAGNARQLQRQTEA